jgi:adenine-specific DNA-methyltransferase
MSRFIKYLGSKKLLIPTILDVVRGDDIHTVADLFSGTVRIGYALKQAGYRVISNDLATYSRIAAECYLKADRDKYYEDACRLVEEYNSSSMAVDGWFTQRYAREARFYTPENAMRIEFIRQDIERRELDPILKSVILFSLIEAADSVDSTCGQHMSYLKAYAARALKPLRLRVPELLPQATHGDAEVFQSDANQLVRNIYADAMIIDPPYTSSVDYGAYFHLHETLSLFDNPEVYGVVNKRADCRTKKSNYTSKRKALGEFKDLIDNIKTKKIVVTFSDEAIMTREQIEEILSSRGSVTIIEKDYKRYVGAQIGQFNLNGQRVGEVSHLRNKERIYVVKCTN